MCWKIANEIYKGDEGTYLHMKVVLGASKTKSLGENFKKRRVWIPVNSFVQRTWWSHFRKKCLCKNTWRKSYNNIGNIRICVSKNNLECVLWTRIRCSRHEQWHGLRHRVSWLLRVYPEVAVVVCVGSTSVERTLSKWRHGCWACLWSYTWWELAVVVGMAQTFISHSVDRALYNSVQVTARRFGHNVNYEEPTRL